jgi:hypothetical protein
LSSLGVGLGLRSLQGEKSGLGVVSRNWLFSRGGPHPSPLPKGEGTEWGIFKNYTDLKVIGRIHNRLGISGRRMTQYTSVGSLSLWERAGVRGS